MSTLGQGSSCYVLNLASVSDTAAHVSTVTFLQHARIVSYILVANGTLDGAWKVEGCNDYSGAGGSADMQPPTAGTWVDITSGFKTLGGAALAAVVHGTAATQAQAVQSWPVGFRVIRVTFTATTGTGAVQAIIAGGEF